MDIKFVEAFYLDDKRSQLLIHTNQEISEYQLYWTFDNDINTNNKTPLFKSNKKDANFDFEYSKKKRTYFIIEFITGESILFSYRILPIDGLYNFRDIGGYKTNNGKRIKWGIGYRSDYLFYLKDSSYDYILDLGIKAIIDYRSEQEILESPNRNINEKVTYICNPDADIAEMAGVLQSGQVKDSRINMLENAKKQIAMGITSGDTHMVNQQLKFTSDETAKKAFSKAMKVLSNKENAPSLQHCRGGKDRTGFGLMILEGILGVDTEDLIYDYMLTARARKEKNKQYYQKFLDESKDEEVAKYMFSLFDTKEIFIEASINKILNEYNSIRDYACKELNLTMEDIKQLESIYLEDSD